MEEELRYCIYWNNRLEKWVAYYMPQGMMGLEALGDTPATALENLMTQYES